MGMIAHDMMELLGLIFPAGARVYNRVALWITACGFVRPRDCTYEIMPIARGAGTSQSVRCWEYSRLNSRSFEPRHRDFQVLVQGQDEFVKPSRQ